MSTQPSWSFPSSCGMNEQAGAVERFAGVLAKTGGTVQRVTTAAEVVARVAAAAREQDTRRVLYEPGSVIEALDIKLQLAAHGVELLPVERAGGQAGNISVGLTGAELAIAETGTLLIGGRPGGWGLASVLPWVHLVVLRADAVVEDLPTAFARFTDRLHGGQRDWVWVTGPSRTADIGHTLVLGAHGPNALHVLVLS